MRSLPKIDLNQKTGVQVFAPKMMRSCVEEVWAVVFDNTVNTFVAIKVTALYVVGHPVCLFSYPEDGRIHIIYLDGSSTALHDVDSDMMVLNKLQPRMQEIFTEVKRVLDSTEHDINLLDWSGVRLEHLLALEQQQGVVGMNLLRGMFLAIDIGVDVANGSLYPNRTIVRQLNQTQHPELKRGFSLGKYGPKSPYWGTRYQR